MYKEGLKGVPNYGEDGQAKDRGVYLPTVYNFLMRRQEPGSSGRCTAEGHETNDTNCSKGRSN